MATGTIFFDYDGTLHNSLLVYAPAFRKGYAWLVEQGHAQPRAFDDAWIGHWLGWSTKEMWTTFMPELPEPVWREAASIVGAEMDRLSATGHGALFEGVPQALDTLKARGYTLAFLSNCRHDYRDAHRSFYGLDRWFTCYHCAEDLPGLPKWRIYQTVADDGAHPYPHVMVGDRFHDLEVATHAHLPFVGCAYGFGLEGELAGADALATAPGELVAAIGRVMPS